MGPLVRHLSASAVARRLGISVKALRLYEQRGLLAPSRTPAGWRAYDPGQIDRVTNILALRTLGLSLAQIGELLEGESSASVSIMAEHEVALEGRIASLVDMLKRLRRFRSELAGDQVAHLRNAARCGDPKGDLTLSIALPWPWDGEQVMLSIRPLTYITGPLGSGKTRLAQHLAETLPDAAFLGLDRCSKGAAPVRARLNADSALRSRVDRMIASLIDDGATATDALLTLVVALQEERPNHLVIDLVEHGLDAATQQAVSAQLRRLAKAESQRALVLLTRSSAILDPSTIGADETIILCPANHSVPIQVGPYPGAVGYEALVTCLAAPEVRARTAGTIAWRPVPTNDQEKALRPPL